MCGFTFAAENVNTSYRLGSGDKIKVTIFNQEDMTGEYTLDGSGNFSLPLVGTVTAKDMTITELESRLKDVLSPDYLVNPQISIQVLNYRPFYILGEVEKPGSYPFVDGMTYLNAVAIAGGFTYRAKEDFVYVIRGNNTNQDTRNQKEEKIKMEMQVMPGDIIRVDERMF